MKATHALESVVSHLGFDEQGDTEEVEERDRMENVSGLYVLRIAALCQNQLTGHTYSDRSSVDVVPGYEPWKDVNQ